MANFVKETKRNTTLWVKKKTGHQDFSWQAGYGSFSVSESQLPVVAKDVDNQEEHHRKSTFQDECSELLRLHGQSWDEKYVWD